MSSDAQGRLRWQRWRAPVIGAAAGLAVAAALVGPAALADSGGTPARARAAAPSANAVKAKAAGMPGLSKQRGTPAPGGVPHQFLDAIAQLVQAGTINAAQGRALDAQIQSGSIDPHQLVSSGVVTASQMAAVNDRLRAVKESLAPQQQGGPAAAAAACGKGAGSAPAA